MTKPVVLCILDGWGLNPDPTGNAVAQAATPNFDRTAPMWACRAGRWAIPKWATPISARAG